LDGLTYSLRTLCVLYMLMRDKTRSSDADKPALRI